MVIKPVTIICICLLSDDTDVPVKQADQIQGMFHLTRLSLIDCIKLQSALVRNEP